MSFLINSYVELLQRFTSWEALRSFLTSNDGGNLRILTQEQNPTYAIIRYVKGKSDFTKNWVRDSRSVVWNVVTNRPVCFAPIKAEKGFPPKDLSGVYISDFVDGTMINAFRPSSGPSMITTRTNLGASGSFYDFYSNPPMTFAQMFNDSLSAFGGFQNFLDSVLSPGQYASFVLQHPMNRIVAPVSQPRVFLTHLGTVNEDGSSSVHFTPDGFPPSLLPFAARKYESPVDFKALCKRNGYLWQGLVFQDSSTSRRWRLRNSSYSITRTLRGAEACGFERFLRLRREGQIKDYLKTYRDESKMMWSFETLFRDTTQALYDAYVEKNKLKKKGMKDIDLPLRPHVYALHGLYLKSVGLNKDSSTGQTAGNVPVVPISKDSVIQYVNGLALEDQKRLVGTAYKSILVSS